MSKMASEDISVKNVVIFYALPVVLFLIVIKFLAKKMKVLKLKMSARVSDRILSRLHKRLQKEKDIVFSELCNLGKRVGRNLQILEIGSGSGMNFKHFPNGSEIVCLDPNPYNKSYLEKNLHEINPNVSMKKFVAGFAENMPEVEDSSCDAVVCTLVLCTVRDVNAVLKEIKRVLKPNGVFFFVEHVASKKGTFKRRVQNIFNPLWKVMCDGCHLNRETWNTLNTSGFSSVNLTHFTLKMFKIPTPCIFGQAVK